MARSSSPSPLKSPVARAVPKLSHFSEAPLIPGVLCVSSRARRPRTSITVAEPCPSIVTLSAGAPTTSSSLPSPSKSPVASDAPHWSVTAAACRTHDVFCVIWYGLRPFIQYTVTAPPDRWLGAPTTSSSLPSPSRSPAASAAPNRSLDGFAKASSAPATSPPGEPSKICTTPLPSPPGTRSPTNSSDTPTARSAHRSPLKSPTASADPNESPGSAPSWVSFTFSPEPYMTVTEPALAESYGAATARSGRPSPSKSSGWPPQTRVVAGETPEARGRIRQAASRAFIPEVMTSQLEPRLNSTRTAQETRMHIPFLGPRTNLHLAPEASWLLDHHIRAGPALVAGSPGSTGLSRPGNVPG